MIGLKRFTAVGMPWHGLAIDGDLSTLAGTKNITGDGDCVVVRHPSAPGANRSVAQQASDAAKGLEWRDYALLCGSTRAVNGGPVLGGTAWLYCAPDGRTWRMTAEIIEGDTTVDINVWRRELYGRFGRNYSITDELVGTLTWAPGIPSWYSGGYTIEDVIDHIKLSVQPKNLTVSPDGSLAYLHVYCEDFVGNLVESIYLETTSAGRTNRFGTTSALVGIIKIQLSGSGDPFTNGGEGITATVTEDLAFEGGLVNRADLAEDPPGWSFSYFVGDHVDDLTETPPPGYPGDDCGNPQATAFVRAYTASAVAEATSLQGSTYTNAAILYKTPHGVVTRTIEIIDTSIDFTIDVAGSYSREYELWNCADPSHPTNFEGTGWWWDNNTPGAAGTCITGELNVEEWNSETVTWDFFGEVQFAYEVKKVKTTYHLEPIYGSTTPGVSCPGESETEDTVVYVNDVEVPHADVYLRESYLFNQNLQRVFMYVPDTSAASNYQFTEHMIGTPDSGAATEVWSGSQVSTYLGNPNLTPDTPQIQETGVSYQPVTEDLVHAAYTESVINQYC
ncbi:MAG: hypothetical protein KDJ39_05825 [Gammaproteobacteria bacterium]|nr:hypothetical protein [Gammaproteobacteria bacterium]